MGFWTTKEVAEYLRLNEKKIYSLVAAGQLPAARISGKWLFSKELIDRWVDEHTIWPTTGAMDALADRLLVLQGSDEWLLDRAIEELRGRIPQDIATAQVGSFAGLAALAGGRAHAAGIHVADAEVAAALDPLPPTFLVGLFRRQQVLAVHPRHAASVQSVADVALRGLRFARRQDGSATWRLTQRLLAEVGLSPDRLATVGPWSSHVGVALAIASGEADAGIAIRVAAELAGLPLVPVHEETFRLAIPAPLFAHPDVARLVERTIDWLDSNKDRGTPGYDFGPLGRLQAPGRAA